MTTHTSFDLNAMTIRADALHTVATNLHGNGLTHMADIARDKADAIDRAVALMTEAITEADLAMWQALPMITHATGHTGTRADLIDDAMAKGHGPRAIGNGLGLNPGTVHRAMAKATEAEALADEAGCVDLA